MNKKLILKLLILIISISLIFSFIVSQDFYHLDTCNEEHCHKCSVIYYAQNIVKLAVTIFICLSIYFFIDYCLSDLHEELKIFMHKSLVFQKVQFNE